MSCLVTPKCQQSVLNDTFAIHLKPPKCFSKYFKRNINISITLFSTISYVLHNCEGNGEAAGDQVHLTHGSVSPLSSNQKMELAYVPIIIVQISMESQTRLHRDPVEPDVGLMLNVTHVSPYGTPTAKSVRATFYLQWFQTAAAKSA